MQLAYKVSVSHYIVMISYSDDVIHYAVIVNDVIDATDDQKGTILLRTINLAVCG